MPGTHQACLADHISIRFDTALGPPCSLGDTGLNIDCIVPKPDQDHYSIKIVPPAEKEPHQALQSAVPAWVHTWELKHKQQGPKPLLLSKGMLGIVSWARKCEAMTLLSKRSGIKSLFFGPIYTKIKYCQTFNQNPQ
jgi:hypothetical protein